VKRERESEREREREREKEREREIKKDTIFIFSQSFGDRFILHFLIFLHDGNQK